MTALDPEPEPAAGAALLDQAVAWRRVAGELDAAVTGTSALAAGIAEAWTDRAGRGWVQRLDLVGRELDRQAGVAADLVRLMTSLADGVGEPAPVSGPDATVPLGSAGGADRTEQGSERVDPPGGIPGGAGPSWSLPGVRLGGTDGGRASERRGVVVPTLPDQPG